MYKETFLRHPVFKNYIQVIEIFPFSSEFQVCIKLHQNSMSQSDLLKMQNIVLGFNKFFKTKLFRWGLDGSDLNFKRTGKKVIKTNFRG